MSSSREKDFGSQCQRAKENVDKQIKDGDKGSEQSQRPEKQPPNRRAQMHADEVGFFYVPATVWGSRPEAAGGGGAAVLGQEQLCPQGKLGNVRRQVVTARR